MSLELFKKVIRSKAKELKANLSQGRIDAMAAKLHAKNPDLTEEADHEEPVNNLNDLMPFADIAKDDDRLRTLEKKDPTKKPADPENPTNEDPTKKSGDDEPPAWAKKLQSDLDAMKTEKAQSTNKTKLKDLIKDVPESYYKGRVVPEKEEDLQAFADEVQADWEGFRQEQITAGLMTQTAPGGGDTKAAQGKAAENAIKEWAASKGAEVKK